MRNQKRIASSLLVGGILLGYLFWQHMQLDQSLATIVTILHQHATFKNLNAERMKPGWNKVCGTVTSSNDLHALKQELVSAGIRNCAVLVQVEK